MINRFSECQLDKLADTGTQLVAEWEITSGSVYVLWAPSQAALKRGIEYLRSLTFAQHQVFWRKATRRGLYYMPDLEAKPGYICEIEVRQRRSMP